MDTGPVSRDQFIRLGREWSQGDHMIVTGGTGSGKTTVARRILDQRIVRSGHVVVFVGKLQPDKTITDDYKGFQRWTTFHRNPSPFDNKILLWPNTDRYKSLLDKRKHQRAVFLDALNRLGSVGKWCVQIDEGLYTCSPTFLNLGNEIAMLSSMGRSADLSLMVLAQRPSHLPLVLYSNASQVFAAQTGVPQDQKRLAELNTREPFREVAKRIADLGHHDFLWLPVKSRGAAEVVNLGR